MYHLDTNKFVRDERNQLIQTAQGLRIQIRRRCACDDRGYQFSLDEKRIYWRNGFIDEEGGLVYLVGGVFTYTPPKRRSATQSSGNTGQRVVATDVPDEDALYNTRMPSSVRRYDTGNSDKVVDANPVAIVPANSRGRTLQPVAPAQQPRQRQGPHPLLSLGLGMLVMLVLWMGLSAAFNWWQTYQDDLHYGRPRTFQVDAWVGHEQTGVASHFIAVNLNRHIQIIEFPGGDAEHAKIYVGPVLFGEGQELTPVTLEFKDVDGDGKPDMIVHFGSAKVVFVNTGTQFRPSQPGDHL